MFKAKDLPLPAPPDPPVLAAPPPGLPALDWDIDMDAAPRDRSSVYLTADPDSEDAGVLGYWRTTRQKANGVRGWVTVSYWAATLTNRPLEFAPEAWRWATAARPLE